MASQQALSQVVGTALLSPGSQDGGTSMSPPSLCLS